MEPSHLAKKELQKMKEQEQKLQLQMDYSLPGTITLLFMN